MTYLVNMPSHEGLSELRARHKAYQAYLQSVRDRMPAKAFEFASAAWHYDPDDHRCPHDAWVESVSVVEPSTAERQEERRIEIRIELLGAYHDGRIRIIYPGVRGYSLFHPSDHDVPLHAGGHGDWLVDEIRVSDRSRAQDPLIVHEIVFSMEGTWMIEAEDVVFEWLPANS
jgi:hypothetical protein